MCLRGGGHIAEVLKNNGYNVYCTDLIDRGYKEFNEQKDFLFFPEKTDKDIITNPPYILAKEFVEIANDIVQHGAKIAMLLKLTFLETKNRYELFKKYPPKRIYVFISRIACAKNGEFTDETGAVCYAWFIWEKGFSGDPIIKWI